MSQYGPATPADAERCLRSARAILTKLIEGKGDESWVEPGAGRGSKEAAIIQLVSGEDQIRFKVHADTTVAAVKTFLTKATTDAICLINGPKGGRLVGLNGQPVEGLRIYVK